LARWDPLFCDNHPERIALERCEVCGKPLCAYCLYYTDDGQRLCQQHAEAARLRGAVIEEPGAYAEQLIGAQVGAAGKLKRGREAADDGLYRGNTHDLLALLGLAIGVTTMGACCGMGYCLPGVGLVLSLAALINAKKAYDPRRTRRLALVGVVVTGVWVLVIAACIAAYGFSLAQVTRVIQPVNLQALLATETPTPSPTVESTPPVFVIPTDTPDAVTGSPGPG